MYVPSTLILFPHRVLITLCPVGTEVIDINSYTSCFSQLATSMSNAAFQHAGCGRFIASLKVLGFFLLFLPHRKDFLRIGGGVGVSCAGHAVELVRNVQIGVKS